MGTHIYCWYEYKLLQLFQRAVWQSGFRGGSVVKNPSANVGDARDMGSVPGLGRSSGGGHGNPLQYSCLKNPMERGAWWATVHGVAELEVTKDASTHVTAIKNRPLNALNCFKF